MTTTARHDVTVRDDAHRLTAPSECARIDDHTVTCRGGPYEDPSGRRAYEFHDLARINLGDGDDSAVAAGAIGVSLSGGAGEDRLTGGPRADRLAGDAGTNTLLGEGGDDLLLGGAAGDRRRDLLTRRSGQVSHEDRSSAAGSSLRDVIPSLR